VATAAAAAAATAAAADGGSRRHRLPRRGVGRKWGQGGGSLGRHLTTCRRPKPRTTTVSAVAVAAVLITTTNNSVAVDHSTEPSCDSTQSHETKNKAI